MARYDPGMSADVGSESAGSRRERLRRQTLAEIKERALAQVAEGGPGALSLNAVGRAMGMSGPAVYRYFASRDALLAALVTDGYAALADALGRASDGAAGAAPAERLAALADAYRGWAREQPQLYALLFGVRPAGYADPDAAIDAIQPAMERLLAALGAIAAGRPSTSPADGLDDELRAWAGRRGSTAAGDPPDPWLLRLGVLTWSRLHGLVGLELAGILGDMGLDPQRLVAAETADVVAAVERGGPAG